MGELSAELVLRLERTARRLERIARRWEAILDGLEPPQADPGGMEDAESDGNQAEGP